MKSWRAFGETVAVVHLEGAPHEGHAGLVRAAQREADRVLAALLPAHAPAAPDEPADAPSPHEPAATRLMDEAGADALYLPSRKVFRPALRATTVHVRGLCDVLDGEEDGAALDGFAGDMIRLFAEVQPDVAVFCELAWQRRLIAEQVSRDFDLCERFVSAEAMRDDDGAPASVLDPAARAPAARLWRQLRHAAAAIAGGADADETLDALADALAEAGAEVEYLDLRDALTLDEIAAFEPGRPARIFAAIDHAGTRLRDSVGL